VIVLGPIEFCSLLLRGVSTVAAPMARAGLPGVAVVMFGKVGLGLGRRGYRYASRRAAAG
jgi:hypothetical protein